MYKTMFCVDNLFIVQNIQGIISGRSSRSRRCSCVLYYPSGSTYWRLYSLFGGFCNFNITDANYIVMY